MTKMKEGDTIVIDGCYEIHYLERKGGTITLQIANLTENAAPQVQMKRQSNRGASAPIKNLRRGLTSQYEKLQSPSVN
jgi:hypothetical protein